VILFHVLPGNSLHVKKQTSGLKPTEGYDSHSSSNHQEWCVELFAPCSSTLCFLLRFLISSFDRYLFDESQCLPAYVLTVKAIESKRTAGDDV
jgi:hypothetical protein